MSGHGFGERSLADLGFERSDDLVADEVAGGVQVGHPSTLAERYVQAGLEIHLHVCVGVRRRFDTPEAHVCLLAYHEPFATSEPFDGRARSGDVVRRDADRLRVLNDGERGLNGPILVRVVEARDAGERVLVGVGSLVVGLRRIEDCEQARRYAPSPSSRIEDRQGRGSR